MVGGEDLHHLKKGNRPQSHVRGDTVKNGAVSSVGENFQENSKPGFLCGFNWFFYIKFTQISTNSEPIKRRLWGWMQFTPASTLWGGLSQTPPQTPGDGLLPIPTPSRGQKQKCSALGATGPGCEDGCAACCVTTVELWPSLGLLVPAVK